MNVWWAMKRCHNVVTPAVSSLTIGAVAIVFAWGFETTPSPATASDATALVTAAAKRHRVPVDLALRVGRAESGLQCGRHNKSGASGPLQIMPSTARAMGYRGPSIRRASCAVQTEWGMRHLAMCYRGAKGDRRIAAACHYQGVSALQRVSRAGAAYARRVVR
jgi:soluble lytic murein transglycosylase-like protein